MVRFLEIFLRVFYMKMNLIAIIAGGIGILAIISVLILIPDEKSDVVEIDLFTSDKEIQVIETTEIQEKLDEIEKKNLENKYSPKDREWLTSGPFQIDRSEYVLGEKIFLRIGGLSIDEKGQVAFLRPLNSTYYSVYFTIPFDGADKTSFNYYLQPSLSKNQGLCTADDFIGNWRVVFRGTDYPNLDFKITEDILPGDEDDYEPVC